MTSLTTVLSLSKCKHRQSSGMSTGTQKISEKPFSPEEMIASSWIQQKIRGCPKTPLLGGGVPLPIPPRVAISSGKPFHPSCPRYCSDGKVLRGKCSDKGALKVHRSFWDELNYLIFLHKQTKTELKDKNHVQKTSGARKVMKFQTNYCYTDRETKARYVWQKYKPLLNGRILDVGADECHLKQYLPKNVEYVGIGLGGHPDRHIDLEKEKIPFEDSSFNCVLCLDVLEHLENIHEAFDELCRVTKRNVIISLPNPWNSLWNSWQNGDEQPGQALKFYGLPLEKPSDRHKWFFSAEEAEIFIQHRAKKNQMRIIQMDYQGVDTEQAWHHKLLTIPRTLKLKSIFRSNFPLKNIYAGTLWVVLEKNKLPCG